MTRAAVTHIRDSLTSLISPQLIRRRARSLGVVKRQRKVDIVALVCALVLGFERGARRSLASFRRAYCSTTGVTRAPSAFYGRFTPELAELMQQLTMHAFEHLKEGTSRLQRTLAAFAKVFIADGSLVRLHPNLQDDYPSVWTNRTKAGAKLHVTTDGASRTPEILRIVPGSKHDVTLLNVGSWCKDALRWEIELLFRELKSQIKLDDMPSGNKAATECLLYAALLTLAIGRKLRRALQMRQHTKNAPVRVFSSKRWTSKTHFQLVVSLGWVGLATN